jgi:uncharacterized protein involved in response to NO
LDFFDTMARAIPLLSRGFRPFFMLSGLLAALAVPLWLAGYLTGVPLGVGDALRWHIHEMLFGYLSGALAGFLLTAVPNWTNRPAVTGGPLLAFALLWIAGRVSFFIPAGPLVQIILLPAFLALLALWLLRELLASGNRRNLPVVGLVTLLMLAQILFLAEFEAIGLRLGFAVAALLIGLIGGRVTPVFTANWLKAKGVTDLPVLFNRFDAGTMGISAFALLLWVFLPVSGLSGLLLLLAGLLQMTRVMRWRGARVSEPLIWMLHIGFSWMPLGLLLLSGSAVWPDVVPQSAGLHALGAGAVGQMTLIIMMRAILGHSGAPLRADMAAKTAFLAVTLAAVLRVLAAVTGNDATLLLSAALVWSVGFGIFFFRYLPMILSARKN